ncbi:hypothetical protein A2153_02915 [Candidatus Gottesmanbacteria bacterium RBG_16_38_7b]|uniref:DUF218 domain-containing protein n=1 Tax=Candidatus Gottesmanbacteria bacterium RBG_16_38_7b TaxID=1798372 RepID=A0A1F5YJF1_9BACT|nr:MAG: hypothetical protein A2153_02915 [Candidatus Gottesmanbacteria bacterium RBG_16_38_7b]
MIRERITNLFSPAIPIAEDPKQGDFDTLIVLGKNLGWTSDARSIRIDPMHLSTPSEACVISAALLYQPGTKIIFSGGKTVGPQFPSEAQAMSELFLLKRQDALPEDIFWEEESLDTAGNMQKIAGLMSGQTWGRTGLVTTCTHLPNALKLCQTFRVSVEAGIDAEKTILKRGTDKQINFVIRFQSTPEYRIDRLKEKVRSGVIFLDRESRISQVISHRRRGKPNYK